MGKVPHFVVIDDSPDDRAIAIRELRTEFPDCEITEILDARQFEAAMKRPTFDLVIVDFDLRWNNGLDLMKEIVRRAPSVPVIMFTASGNQEIAVEAMKAGAADYVVKSSTNWPRLRYSARAALERAKHFRQLRESERLAVIGRLVATLTHEINNPLENIRNAFYLISRDPGRVDAAELAKNGMDEVDRIEQIASRTLRYYRQAPEPVAAEIHSVLDDVLFLYSKRMRMQGIQANKKYSSENGRVMVLPGEIRQAFANVVSNAIDAMPAGGTMDVGVGPAGDRQDFLRVSFLDAGTGIPEGQLNRVFDPFFSTKGENGTGLGLWIVRDIVERHGGSVKVENREDGESGTRVTIELPRAAAGS